MYREYNLSYIACLISSPVSGLAQLGVSEFPAVDTLATLDISYCRALTDTGLAHLHKSVAAVQTHSTFRAFYILSINASTIPE